MSADRDHELGAALRGLPTPDHGPTFWDDLERRLAEEPAPVVDLAVPRPGGFTGRRSHRRRPRPSPGLWLVSAAAAVALVVTAVAVLRPGEGGDRIVTTPPPTTSSGEQQGWSSLSMSGLAPRRGHVAVWTGREMVVWGGRDFDSLFNDGATYVPSTDQWTPLPAAPLRGGDNYTAVWTGTKMLVWGSALQTTGGRESIVAEGASYDPVSRTWTRMAAAPVAGRSGHTAVWTGERMLVWGGGTMPERILDDGAAYDPATDTWTRIAPAPIGGRESHTAVWTGTAMIVWGGNCCGEGGEQPLPADGAAYDPSRGTWSRVSAAPLDGRYRHAAVWTGDRMLVVGGFDADAAAYDPAADRWERLPDAGLVARIRLTAVWTGSEMLVWGGEGPGGTSADGAAYDPARRSWRRLVAAPLTRRGDHTAVWTGGAMLVWGGSDGNEAFFADGAAYRPGR